MYDVVVVGAGPAGSQAARYLSKKYKVLIMDKRQMDESPQGKRDICCGGLLAPDAQKMLAHLGLGVPKEVLVGPQMFSVQSIDYDNKLVRHYQRHYINIDRELFDRWLTTHIPKRVHKLYGVLFTGIKKEKDHYLVKYRNGSKQYQVKAKMVIGADGAHSRIRNQYFKGEEMPETYVSVQKWYETKGVMPYYVSFFDEEVTDFYSWIIQKDEKLLIGTGIPIETYDKEKFNKLESDAKKARFDIGSCVKETGTLIMRTTKLSQINTAKDNVFLVGEAAGFISPSSAEGISYALKSGERLARLINRSTVLLDKRYASSIVDIKANLLFKQFKSFVMYNKVLRKLVMRSKVMSMSLREDMT